MEKSKIQIKIKNFNFYSAILIFAFCIFNFWGCATIKEAAKETAKSIAGVSTKVLEDGRIEAVSKQFNYDYNTCFNKTETILKERGSIVYAKDLKKHMIAIYVSSEDTTPVGIFFKEADANNTLIEVSSPSTYAKEFIAKRLFSILDQFAQ